MAVYPCKRCNKNISFKEVRYKNNGKDLICKDCYDIVVNKKLVSDNPKPEQKTLEGDTAKKRFMCFKCRYNFTYKPSRAKLRCPNCGREELLKNNYTASRLLKEAEEWK